MSNRDKRPQSVKERRFVHFPFDPQHLINMLKWDEKLEIVEGLPDDAILMNASFDPQRYSLVLLVASMKYEPVEQGTIPPMVTVAIRTTKYRSPEAPSSNNGVGK